jgi:streptogramin lyase
VDIALNPVASADFPFRRMTFTQDAFPEGTAIFDLWIDLQGNLWAATEAGLYVEWYGGFTLIYEQPLTQVVGLQEDPYTVWALGADGATIHAFRGETWTVYGPAEGWDPLPGEVSSDEPTVPSDGVIWLATGADDLRRFDPATGTWSSLRATDLGFAPADPDYQGHFLTDTVVLPDGSLWIADCIGLGEGFDGQGVRLLQTGAWAAVPGTEGQCIFELATDAAGRVWIGGEEALLTHDPVTGAWTELPLPPWERAQYITDLVFDPSGEPWVGLLRCGPACCDTFLLYAHQAEGWREVRATTAEALYLIPSVAFGPDGTPWTCSLGEVMRWPGGVGETIGQIGYGRCEIIADDAGTLWIAILDQPGGGLWQVTP